MLRITKTANKGRLTISRSEWEKIGRQAGWWEGMTTMLGALPNSPDSDIFDPVHPKVLNQPDGKGEVGRSTRDDSIFSRLPKEPTDESISAKDKVSFMDLDGKERAGFVTQVRLDGRLEIQITDTGDMTTQDPSNVKRIAT